MKPTPDICNRRKSGTLAVSTSRVFPKTDFNYQATTLANLEGRWADLCKSSFRAISQDYFANEAPRHFAHEAGLFFMMVMTVTLPLLNASAAALGLIRIR
ncbi:MAG TPA: hypothetical protein VNW28_06030 [Chthoniobacterales bacterium]|nr:hypothetical protein [Chthoniobacterales bacterium]